MTPRARGIAAVQALGAKEPVTLIGELLETIDALSVAGGNVVLAFHDWPAYETESAQGERTRALAMLADALFIARTQHGGPERA